MADKITIKVEGLAESLESLREFATRATEKNVIKRTLIKAAQPFIDAARTRAPRGATGKLQDLIGVSDKLTRRQRSQHKKVSAIEVFAGPPSLRQAVPQEFGTVHHPPQPYMRPAWDSQKRTALTMFKNDFAGEVEKARARAARKIARLAAKNAQK